MKDILGNENPALRAFLIRYAARVVSVMQMKRHMQESGYPFWPDWVETCYVKKANCDSRLTIAGAQLWIRHLLALEQQR